MSVFISDVFAGIDDIEPLNDILDRQDNDILKTVNPNNFKRAKKLITWYSVSHTPFHIFTKKHLTLDCLLKDINEFVKEREINLKKMINGL